MKKLITVCVSRPVGVIMTLTALLLSSIFALSALPLNRLPDISMPRVTVETAYPGMGAAEVRQMVTIPLEDAFSPVKGLEGMSSVSRDETSLVSLNFRWGAESENAAALVREAVDAAYPGLNYGVEKPIAVSGGYAPEPHAVISVRAKRGNGSFARNLADYELRARLRRLEGTGAVILSGGEVPEIQVAVDIAKLASRGMAPADMANLVAGEITDIPAGSIREGGREIVTVARAMPESTEELGEISLPGENGAFTINELGEVKTKRARLKSLFIYNNREQTALEVFRRPGADPVKLSGDIKRTLQEASSLFERDAEINLVYDASASILADLKNLGLAAFLSALAVTGILVLFLGRLSYSLLAGLAIPLSAAGAINALALTGRSLNAMSLGGITLGIGLVSDTAVIVLDLLCRQTSSCKGNDPADVISRTACAAASVSGSNLAGTLTTGVVFIPVIFLPGILGSLYGDLAIALITSVLVGWIYAQFALPCLFRIVQERIAKKENIVNKRKNGKLSKVPLLKPPLLLYSRFLKRILRRPLPVLVLSVAFCVVGFLLILLRPASFSGNGSEGELHLTLDYEPLTTLEAALPRGIEISKMLTSLPFIETFYGRMGAETEDRERRSDPGYRRERLTFRCFLKKGIRSGEAVEEIYRTMRNVSGPELTVTPPPQPVEALLGLSGFCTLAVKGGSREDARERTRRAGEMLRSSLGDSLADIRERPEGMRTELRLKPRREAAAFAGVTLSAIAGTVYTATEGIVPGRMEIEGRPVNIRVLGKDNPPMNALPVIPDVRSGDDSSAGTAPLFLDALSSTERREAEAALARQDRSDVIYLELIAAPGFERSLPGKVSALLRSSGNKFSQYGVSLAGESVFSRYKASLITAVLLVLMLLYITIGAQFESFTLPIILMLAIPFSLAGAGPALFLSGSYLDSGAALALIVLFGISVNNSIVLYESAEEKFQKGIGAPLGVYRGSVEWLRPVLITTLTTVIALFPLCFTVLGGSQTSLARTMAGGIIASAFLCLFVLPPVFIPFLKNMKGGSDGAN